jgi:hypothetical protein
VATGWNTSLTQLTSHPWEAGRDVGAGIKRNQETGQSGVGRSEYCAIDTVRRLGLRGHMDLREGIPREGQCTERCSGMQVVALGKGPHSGWEETKKLASQGTEKERGRQTVRSQEPEARKNGQ